MIPIIIGARPAFELAAAPKENRDAETHYRSPGDESCL